MSKKLLCNRCGHQFKWGVSSKGRPMPVDMDGAPHWERCRERRAGTRKLEVRSYGTTTGPDYRPSCNCNGVLPWVECACSQPSTSTLINNEADARFELVLAEID